MATRQQKTGLPPDSIFESRTITMACAIRILLSGLQVRASGRRGFEGQELTDKDTEKHLLQDISEMFFWVGYQQYVVADIILSSIELNLQLPSADPGSSVERKDMAERYNLDASSMQLLIR